MADGAIGRQEGPLALAPGQFEAVMQGVRVGIVLVDVDGHLTYANRMAKELLELPEEMEQGVPFSECIMQLKPCHLDGSAVDVGDLPIAEVLEGEEPPAFEFTVEMPSGTERVFSLRGDLVRDERGVTCFGSFFFPDVTETKRLEQIKNDFLDTAAHELKTPVAIMKGFTQLLLRSMTESSLEHRKVLQAIDKNADRMNRLVNALLDVSRLESDALRLRKERFNLSNLVQEVAERDPSNCVTHQVTFEQQEDVFVWGDRDRLEAVIFNLIDNARRYSPQGGLIRICLSSLDGEVVVSIRDSGVGISKHHRRHIFERFYRAHGGTAYDFGGIGLSLHISRGIIARHGGRMWFESEEGKGSTFYFSIPFEEVEVGRH